jgi:1-acyl-sn-glycerol-3-phosphate acyltransferase
MVASLARRVIRGLLGILCKVEAVELDKVPLSGPLIIVTNHINFLEVPLLYVYLHPRRITGIIKKETWDNPLLGKIADAWRAIPIDRTASDMAAMRKAEEELAKGGIIAIAPEGTRSGHGRLQRGHAGVAALALRSDAAILPIAHFGGEDFWDNLRKARRTRVRLRVGKAFRLKRSSAGSAKSARQEMIDEIMYRLAALLPPEYRGVYSDPERATTSHLDFAEP